MSLAYRVLYGVGYTPWKEIADLPEVRAQVAALLAREEGGRRPPFGPALDLGCGSGEWAVVLARRGWRVTGVDVVPKALRQARAAVRRAGVDVRLVWGDVTKLAAVGVGGGYTFFLDFGLFHDELTDAQRAAMAREVTAAAAPGATLLMMAWAPKRRRWLPRGASAGEIEAAYRDWHVVGSEPFDVSASPFYRRVTDADPHFHRLELIR